ncbi:hypothetical protein F5Y15DRAFT_116694 [Xylariaceae sp. FL0016]|nr:hypothetical protein F5Y15DRAFT_116694 [Xylariaceae sp. FL0016]
MRLSLDCRGGSLRSFSARRISRPFVPHHEPIHQSSVHLTHPYSSGILIYPDAPSELHRDLASYTSYAERTGLDVLSKTFVGTHYEYTVAAALRSLGFSIKRVGGRSDHGIDLLGVWGVPSAPTPSPLRVLLQCKVSSKNTDIGPKNVRELEGAFVGAPPGWRGPGVLGLLVAQKPATKGIREGIGRSRWPMGYVSCSKDGVLKQMLWNRRAEEEGLEGMGISTKFIGDVGEKEELVLTWNGRPFSPEAPAMDDLKLPPPAEFEPTPKKTRKSRRKKVGEAAELVGETQ